MPPELAGFKSPGEGHDLHDVTMGDHRVVGIAAPFHFFPPEKGWTPVDATWQAVSVGQFDPVAHMRLSSTWLARPTGVGPWIAPDVLTGDGKRAFKVSYGGPDFLPQMTDEQAAAFALATEIRTAMEADGMPDVPIRARWAAKLLPLVYHLSPATIAMVGMPEELIDQTCRIVAGLYGNRG